MELSTVVVVVGHLSWFVILEWPTVTVSNDIRPGTLENDNNRGSNNLQMCSKTKAQNKFFLQPIFNLSTVANYD